MLFMCVGSPRCAPNWKLAFWGSVFWTESQSGLMKGGFKRLLEFVQFHFFLMLWPLPPCWRWGEDTPSSPLQRWQRCILRGWETGRTHWKTAVQRHVVILHFGLGREIWPPQVLLKTPLLKVQTGLAGVRFHLANWAPKIICGSDI